MEKIGFLPQLLHSASGSRNVCFGSRPEAQRFMQRSIGIAKG